MDDRDHQPPKHGPLIPRRDRDHTPLATPVAAFRRRSARSTDKNLGAHTLKLEATRDVLDYLAEKLAPRVAAELAAQHGAPPPWRALWPVVAVAIGVSFLGGIAAGAWIG